MVFGSIYTETSFPLNGLGPEITDNLHRVRKSKTKGDETSGPHAGACGRDSLEEGWVPAITLWEGRMPLLSQDVHALIPAT